MPSTSEPQRFALDFSKGMLSRYSDTVTPNGYGQSMVNWAPCPLGGVEARPSWGGIGNGIASPNVVRIIWHTAMYNFSGTVKGLPILFNQTSGRYRVYGLSTVSPNTLTEIDNVVCTPDGFITAVMGQSGIVFGGPALDELYRVGPVAGPFTNSAGNTVPRNVRALSYYANSFWAGGGKDLTGSLAEETLLWTDPGVGALNNWPADNNVIIDSNGGTSIVDICPFGDDLIIAKDDSIWLLRGAPPDIDIHRLNGGEAIRGKSLVPTPFGLFVVGAYGVYVYDGGPLVNIAEALGNDYQVANRMDSTYFDNKLFIWGAGNQYVYDIPSQSWWMESLAGAPQSILGGHMDGLLTSTSNLDLASRTKLRGDTSGGGDGESSMVLTLATPEYWPNGTEAPTNFRSVDLRLRQRAGLATQAKLHVQINVRDTDGVLRDVGTYDVEPRLAGVYNASIPVPGMTGYGMQVNFSQSVPSTDSTAMDIEEAWIVHQPAFPRPR